jgi:hypothetical protein
MMPNNPHVPNGDLSGMVDATALPPAAMEHTARHCELASDTRAFVPWQPLVDSTEQLAFRFALTLVSLLER